MDHYFLGALYLNLIFVAPHPTCNKVVVIWVKTVATPLLTQIFFGELVAL
jgi:hypothetical protein